MIFDGYAHSEVPTSSESLSWLSIGLNSKLNTHWRSARCSMIMIQEFVASTVVLVFFVVF